jgi:hypothetical protein
MQTFLLKLSGARKSLTIWFNGVSGSAIVALPVLHDNFPQLKDYLTQSFYHKAMGAIVAANILIRFRTSLPLEKK